MRGSSDDKRNQYSANNGSPLRKSSPIRGQSPSHFSPSGNDQLRVSQNFDRVEQGELAKIFKDTIFLERELESAKIELTLKPDYNLLDAFRMLDNSGKGHITPTSLLESLWKLHKLDDITQDDVFLFFRRYDSKSKGMLSFHDFCQAVTPLSKEYAVLLTGRPDFYSNKAVLPNDYFN